MSGGPGSALRAPESGTRARAGRGLWRLPSPPVLAARGCSSGAPPAAVRPTRVGLSRLCPAAGPPAGARRSGPSRWGRAGSPAAGPRSRPVLRGSLLPACPTPALTAQRERRSREGGGRRGATGPWVSGLALRLARRGSSRRVPGSAAVRPALRRTADWVSSVIAVPWRGCWRGPRVAGLDDLEASRSESALGRGTVSFSPGVCPDGCPALASGWACPFQWKTLIRSLLKNASCVENV
uniref:Uncharacterized protein n=1 Tax=Mustela putorius furo TaxID=9669 RepID=M3YTB2_MUSPF